MPKGYVIARVDMTNPEAYARYAAAAGKAIADHGGRPLARGGRSEALEGKARARNVVLEFESYDAARRYYYSEQYQAAQGAARRRGGNRNGSGRGSVRNAEGLLDRACRRPRPRGLQAIRRRKRVGVRQIRRALPGARRQACRRQGQGGAAQGRDRVSATTRPRSPATSSEEYRRADEVPRRGHARPIS